MKSPILLFLGVALSAFALQAAEGNGPRHVVVVLDCSHHMAQRLAETGDGQKTRFEVARRAALNLLAQLAADEKHSVSLVLFGHQLAAATTDAHGERPTPADDVEVVCESRPLVQDDLPAYKNLLERIRPGGRSPLCAAVERTADTLPLTLDGKAVIVALTAGVDEPAADGLPRTTADVLKTVQRVPAELHLACISVDARLSQTSQLSALADGTGGAFYALQGSAQLAHTVRLASGLEPVPNKSPDVRIERAGKVSVVKQANLTEARVTQLQDNPAQLVFPTPVDVARADYPLAPRVTVRVLYWAEPVKDAKVYLRGDNFDIVYDRTKEYKSLELRGRRIDGEYVFEQVPHGRYTLDITANVKNRTYEVMRPISVDVDNDQNPLQSFKIQLERSKNPAAK